MMPLTDYFRHFDVYLFDNVYAIDDDMRLLIFIA